MSQKKSLNGERYKTSELGIGSLLYYQRVPIIEIDASDSRRLLFVFDINEEEGLNIQRQWWNGTLSVEPRAFFSSVTQMKDMIYARKREMMYNE